MEDYNKLSSDALFHYTHNEKTFDKILTKGLRYSYSYEFMPIEKGDKQNEKGTSIIKDTNGLILPIISFCDIPISQAYYHRKRYGNYAISFNKEYMRSILPKTLNPIMYVSSKENALTISRLKVEAEKITNEYLGDLDPQDPTGMISMIFADNGKRLNQSKFLKDIASNLYSYFKPYEGLDKKGKQIIYYNEREWRAVLFEDDNKGIQWDRHGTNKPFEKNDTGKVITISESVINQLNRQINDDPNYFIKITPNDLLKAISNIIVPTDAICHKYAKKILNEKFKLFGSSIPKEIRTLLITKLTSFETIEKNY